MKKYFSLLAVMMFSSCVFAGETAKLASKTVKLPSAFMSVVRSFDMSDMTPYQALEKVFEKGTLPEKKDLVGVKGGLFYNKENQDSNFYLVGMSDEASIVPPGGLFTAKNALRVKTMSRPAAGASKTNLELMFRADRSTLRPIVIEDSSMLVTQNSGCRKQYFRKFEKYLIVKLVNSNDEIYAYAYFYYDITE